MPKSLNPMISKQAFEQQLNLLGYRDADLISRDGTLKAWKRPDGTLIALSNKDWIPNSVMQKVFDEVGIGHPGVYRSGLPLA